MKAIKYFAPAAHKTWAKTGWLFEDGSFICSFNYYMKLHYIHRKYDFNNPPEKIGFGSGVVNYSNPENNGGAKGDYQFFVKKEITKKNKEELIEYLKDTPLWEEKGSEGKLTLKPNPKMEDIQETEKKPDFFSDERWEYYLEMRSEKRHGTFDIYKDVYKLRYGTFSNTTVSIPLAPQEWENFVNSVSFNLFQSLNYVLKKYAFSIERSYLYKDLSVYTMKIANEKINALKRLKEFINYSDKFINEDYPKLLEKMQNELNDL